MNIALSVIMRRVNAKSTRVLPWPTIFAWVYLMASVFVMRDFSPRTVRGNVQEITVCPQIDIPVFVNVKGCNFYELIPIKPMTTTPGNCLSEASLYTVFFPDARIHVNCPVFWSSYNIMCLLRFTGIVDPHWHHYKTHLSPHIHLAHEIRGRVAFVDPRKCYFPVHCF